MGIIENFYREVVEITCRVCEVDPEMLFSCNKECFVDARSLIILNSIVQRVYRCPHSRSNRTHTPSGKPHP